MSCGWLILHLELNNSDLAVIRQNHKTVKDFGMMEEEGPSTSTQAVVGR